MKDLNISLKQLRYYLTAAKHKSLRQAAKELRISQPSLSAQLKLLEEALGVELFERTRGGVVLTPLGRELLTEAKNAVNAAKAVIDAANFATKGPSGTFRLGVSPSLGPYSLPWILPAVRHEFSGMKFFVREEVPQLLAEGLTSGNYDLIFSPLPIDDPNVTVMPLFREPIFLVMNIGHPLANNKHLKTSQLSELDILAIEEHHHFFKQVEDLCNRFNARLLRDYEGTSLDAIRQMVYMEMGVAFLPALYIRSEIRERDELQVLSIEAEPIHRTHALAWRNSSPLRNFYRELGVFFQKEIKKQFGNDVIMM
ncbi:MAG: hydrogen peroxide-inducible genes activator [Methyloprofundus sp.]|nr:hydrogen peroxide-inducible genes activator [Methyloprofundus sp.]